MRRFGRLVNWIALGLSLGALLAVWRVASREPEVQRVPIDRYEHVDEVVTAVHIKEVKPELPDALVPDPKRLGQLERVVAREVSR